MLAGRQARYGTFEGHAMTSQALKAVMHERSGWDRLSPDQPEWKHGTRQGYEFHKCRCDLCREANNKRMRDRRAKLKDNDA